MDTYNDFAEAHFEDSLCHILAAVPRQCATCCHWLHPRSLRLPLGEEQRARTIAGGAEHTCEAAPCRAAMEDANILNGGMSGAVWVFTGPESCCEAYELAESIRRDALTPGWTPY